MSPKEMVLRIRYNGLEIEFGDEECSCGQHATKGVSTATPQQLPQVRLITTPSQNTVTQQVQFDSDNIDRNARVEPPSYDSSSPPPYDTIEVFDTIEENGQPAVLKFYKGGKPLKLYNDGKQDYFTIITNWIQYDKMPDDTNDGKRLYYNSRAVFDPEPYLTSDGLRADKVFIIAEG
jgi:hypothetical protein